MTKVPQNSRNSILCILKVFVLCIPNLGAKDAGNMEMPTDKKPQQKPALCSQGTRKGAA